MKKTAVLLYPQFSEYELSVALSILMQGEKPVLIIGLTKEPIRGESGLSVVPDVSLDDINVEEFDSLLLTGCMDVFTLENEEKIFSFIKEIAKEDNIIASISSSPFLLAKAGVLKGKKYTIGMTRENMVKSGVFELENYSEDLIVQDGNLITARGQGFIRFGEYLGYALKLTFNNEWYKEKILGNENLQSGIGYRNGTFHLSNFK